MGALDGGRGARLRALPARHARAVAVALPAFYRSTAWDEEEDGERG
jgi:hypothetical protein